MVRKSILFDYVTGEFVRVMCWAHVYRAVELKLSSIKDKSISQQILLDIEHLQVSYTPKLFEYAYKLFTEKYKKLNNKDVDYFLEYFHKEWISSSNSGWYEGVAINIPSTDNGLESKNAQIKSHYTLRSRLSIDEYLNNAKTMLFDWSKDAIDEESKFKNSVSKTIIENSYIKAFNYLMNKPIMKKFNNQKAKNNLKAYENTMICTKNEYSHLINNDFLFNNYEKCKLDFDSLVNIVRNVHLVKLNEQKWTESQCNCGYCLKNYFCLHVVVIAVAAEKFVIPTKYKKLAIAPKAKRGRPPKAKPALVKQ